MLKIKNDKINQLEKYGFKKERWGYIFYPSNNSPETRYFSSIKIDYCDDKDSWLNRAIMFDLNNMSVYSNDLEQLDLDFQNLQYSYNEFKKKIDELKNADLIEKIED